MQVHGRRRLDDRKQRQVQGEIFNANYSDRRRKRRRRRRKHVDLESRRAVPGTWPFCLHLEGFHLERKREWSWLLSTHSVSQLAAKSLPTFRDCNSSRSIGKTMKQRRRTRLSVQRSSSTFYRYPLSSIRQNQAYLPFVTILFLTRCNDRVSRDSSFVVSGYRVLSNTGFALLFLSPERPGLLQIPLQRGPFLSRLSSFPSVVRC